MGSVWSKNLKISIFGESHGPAIGIVIDGFPAGLFLDMDEIAFELDRRKPKSRISTQRREEDSPEILSGFFEGHTTGAPLCAIFRNGNTRSGDYSELKSLMRPGHADYTGNIRYGGFQDYRGGGHFSGRLTAAVVFGGAVCKQLLATNGIEIAAHLAKIGPFEDFSFAESELGPELFRTLKGELPFIDKSKQEPVRTHIEKAAAYGDSVGGVVECCICGLPAGYGDPFFDSFESVLSHLLFSVPAVKGVEFGAGFQVAELFGSQCNDIFYYATDGSVKTKTNNNGGILGGITNGMPVVFRAAVKPTSSIYKRQQTVNIETRDNSELQITGRHDPCIVPRALPVIEAMAAICTADFVIGNGKGQVLS